MTGKRGPLRYYRDQRGVLHCYETQPRKRQRENNDDFLVHLNYDFFADDHRVHDVVEFINETMTSVFHSSVGRDGAIVWYSNADQKSKGWILEAASTDLANKVCNLNGIYYKYRSLKIQKYNALSSPTNLCWNDYYLKRYGKNSLFVDHHIMATVLKTEQGGACSDMDGVKLQTELNNKLQQLRLVVSSAITKTVKIKSEYGNDRFLLNMRTRHCALQLTYLNYIRIDGWCIMLQRLPEWKGEKPRYNSYDEFLKDYQSEETNRAPQKQTNGQSSDRIFNMEQNPSHTTGASASNSFANLPWSSETSDTENSVSTADEGEFNPFSDSEEENEEVTGTAAPVGSNYQQSGQQNHHSPFGGRNHSPHDDIMRNCPQDRDHHAWPPAGPPHSGPMSCPQGPPRVFQQPPPEFAAPQNAHLARSPPPNVYMTTSSQNLGPDPAMKRGMGVSSWTEDDNARLTEIANEEVAEKDKDNPSTDSREQREEDTAALAIFPESTGKSGSAKTAFSQDEGVVQEPNSKPAIVEEGASATITLQDDEQNLEHKDTANERMKTIIAQQAANTKALRGSLETANEKLSEKDQRIAQLEHIVKLQKKDLDESRARIETIGKKTNAHMKLVSEESAQKDERIAQLEGIVANQRKDIEGERCKVSGKELEIDRLRENVAFQKKDMEEQERILKTKEDETTRLHSKMAGISKELDSTVVKLDAVHRSWQHQFLMLEAKDKQIEVLEKVREAFFLWHPDMNVKEKTEMQKKWKEAIEDL